MPSTARVTIAQRDISNVITESLDHVWDTQYGRHSSVSLLPDTAVTITWPATGEAYVYIVTIIPDVASGVLTVTPVAAGGGWIATIPGAGVKSPLLLPKPDATDFTILCTVVAECSMVFF